MYLDFAYSHFSSAHFSPPELENFWELIDSFGWPEGGMDGFASRVRAELSFYDALRFEHQLNVKADHLQTEAIAAIVAAGTEPDSKFWKDDLWDATRHVVGLGESEFLRVLEEPQTLFQMEAEPGLGFCIDAPSRVYDVSSEELADALRCTPVRPFDDPDGMTSHDIIQHPEHGLGFVSFSDNSPWMWLVFRDETLSSQRSFRSERTTTLYREAENGMEFWFAELGSGRDIFVRSGPLGATFRTTIVPPSDDAESRFDRLVEAAKQDGFTHTIETTTPIAIFCPEIGISSDIEAIREKIDRVLRETGIGEVTHVRVARDHSMFLGAVVDVRRVFGIRKAFDDPIEYTVFKLGDGSHVHGPEIAFELPTPPINDHESLPYFSRLSIEPDAQTEAWAEDAASRCSIDSLDQLDQQIETLRAARERGELSDETMLEEALTLGAFVGNSLDGTWGVGQLFTEQIPHGLLVGEESIKFWPVREVRDRIEGRRVTSLSQLCSSILSKPKGEELPARTYNLAANEGYFDAGVLADGRQALMAAFYPNTFALFFDADGSLLEYATRPSIEERPEGQPEYGPSRMALELWQEELGFEPKTICVKRFSVRAAGVGVEDLPSHYEEFLENPESFSDDEKADYPESIREWLDGGEFVLYWGNDLWVDGDGHVTSS